MIYCPYLFGHGIFSDPYKAFIDTLETWRSSRMKRKAALAAIVLTICFSMGYLAYFGTKLFVDFLHGQFDSCDKATHSCVHKDANPIDY